MPETHTVPVTFECPKPLAEALGREANQRGVTVGELVSSLAVTPLEDQLSELRLTRLDTP